MIIERRQCLRCSAPNTARLANGISVCFNCRTSWRPADPQRDPAPLPRPTPPPVPYPFTPRERARLGVYRAAVAAGFYNEGAPGRLCRELS